MPVLWAITQSLMGHTLSSSISFITTDTPVHLTLATTHVPTRIHNHATNTRGLPVLTDPKYCFVQPTLIDQDEPGDTIQHTFTWSPWAPGLQRWWILTATQAGNPTISNSGIQTFYRPLDPLRVIGLYNTFAPLPFRRTFIGGQRWIGQPISLPWSPGPLREAIDVVAIAGFAPPLEVALRSSDPPGWGQPDSHTSTTHQPGQLLYPPYLYPPLVPPSPNPGSYLLIIRAPNALADTLGIEAIFNITHPHSPLVLSDDSGQTWYRPPGPSKYVNYQLGHLLPE